MNCVATGYSKSRATEAIHSNASFNKQLYKRIPAKRWGEPKDIAAACVYLSSPTCDYVTGTCLVVDGGALGGVPCSNFPRARSSGKGSGNMQYSFGLGYPLHLTEWTLHKWDDSPVRQVLNSFFEEAAMAVQVRSSRRHRQGNYEYHRHRKKSFSNG